MNAYTPVAWDSVLSLPGLSEAEVEVSLIGVRRRGKIERIEINGEKICFELAAVEEGADKKFPFGKHFSLHAVKSSSPHFIGKGRIYFVLPHDGEAVIYLPGRQAAVN